MIAITGGPCGGKSTFLAQAREWLEGYGIYVIVISETATELINEGIKPQILGINLFEKIVMGYQIDREKNYLQAAERIAEKFPVTILCDRGILDCAAYVNEKVFADLCKAFGVTIGSLMDRYKMVLHLTSAAIGAEKFYTLDNNKARSEPVALATDLDKKTEQAWSGHACHMIIDNRTEFEAKMLRARQALARKLNMPIPTEIERKYKVLNFNPNLIPPDAIRRNIVQDYLKSDGRIERRIRSSELYGQKSYYYTEKILTDVPGIRHEEEDVINEKRYYELFSEKDENFYTIVKTRCYIPFANYRFELDIYQSPAKCHDLIIMEVEIPEINAAIEFPPGFELVDVTGIEEYSNNHLAKKP